MALQVEILSEGANIYIRFGLTKAAQFLGCTSYVHAIPINITVARLICTLISDLKVTLKIYPDFFRVLACFFSDL